MAAQEQQIVFISYSHQDVDFVNRFAAILVSCGLIIWKDTRDIPIGSNLFKTVFQAIKNASHFCCIISSHSVASAWVEDELSFAKVRQNEDRSLQIIPVLIDKVEIPDFLRAYRYADLQNRDLSLSNPQLVRVLEAFGVKVKDSITPIVTSEMRKKLLAGCHAMEQKLFEFRDRTEAWSRAKQDIAGPDPDAHLYLGSDYHSGGGGGGYFSSGGAGGMLGGSGFDQSFQRQMERIEREARHEAYEDHKKARIKELRETAEYHWDAMKEIAPVILKIVDFIRQAGVEAGINIFSETDWVRSFFEYGGEFQVWKDLSELLHDVSHKAKLVVANAAFDFDSGMEDEYRVADWTPELIQSETKLKSIIGVLQSWSAFDRERM